MKIKLNKKQKKKINQIAKKFQLVFVVVFGSQAKEQEQKTSDLDIAVLTKKKISYQLFSRLFGQLSEVFKGENIDLRFLNQADPFFRFQVVKNGVLIYGEKNQFENYFAYAYKSFVDDAQPLLTQQKKLIYEKLKNLEKAVL